MSFKGHRPVVFRVLLAFSLVAGLLALEGVPASASGGNVQLSVDMANTNSGHATAGLNWAYTLTVSNAAGDASSGYTVVIDVPSGTSFGSAPGCTNDSPTPTITCVGAAGLAPGSNDTYSIILNILPSVADGTVLDVKATLTDTAGDTNTGSPTDSTAHTTVDAISDVGITYSSSPTGNSAGPWIAGQQVILTAVVTDAGPSSAPDYDVEIGIPSGTDYVSDDSGCTPSATVVSCTGGTLQPNVPVTINITILVHSNLPDGGVNGPNNATVSTTGNEGDDGETNLGTISAFVHRISDLSIVKGGPDGLNPAVVAGDPNGYDYTLTVGNGGPSNANFFANDTLPAGLTFQTTGSSPQCSVVSGQNITCADTIVAGADPQSYTVHVKVDPSVPDQSILQNDATVETHDGSDDSNPDNNSTAGQGGTVSTTITAHANLSLSVDASNGNQIAGDPAGVTFKYTVDNLGPSDNVGGFNITDTLPAGFTYVAAGSDPRCSGSSGTSITCNDPNSFPASEPVRNITVHAKIDSSVLPGSYSDSATVASNNTYDPDNSNDTAYDSVSVINEANLHPDLTITGGPFTAGGASFGGSVKVTNDGYSDNHGGFSVNVPLPSDFVFMSGGTGCMAVTGGFTCSINTGLAATANKSFSFTLRAKSNVPANTYPLTATVSSLGTDDPTPGDNSSSPATNVPIITRADLSLTTAAITYPTGQTAAYANANAAQNSAIYEYNLQNTGPSDAQSVSFSDTLPAGVTFVGACFGTSTCTPNQTLPLSIGTLNGNDGSPTNQSTHIRVKVTADASLRGGPLSKADSASVTSSTIDPGPSLNARSETATVWTVPSTPPNLLASPGNTNAFFKWDPPANFGGVPGGAGSILDFRVRDYLVATGGTPVNTFTVAPDNCGTPGNTFYCALIGTTPYGPALTNGTTYYFTVEARNVVGFSDPNGTRPSVKPTIDASAQQINNGNLTQHTGNSTLPTTTDKQISFQDFPSNTTGVGTILETNTGTPLFCNGPCVGQIVQTKLQDPSLPGIYQITLLYDKTLINGTGQKYTFYYAPTTTASTGAALKVCPSKITTAVVPCVVTKLGSAGANPALKAVIYTKDADPTIGGRGFPK